jgi:hypothetical protein
VEDKLAVSLALRELGAGGRILNRLVVRPLVRDEQMVTPVSADGRYSVVGLPAPKEDSENGAFLTELPSLPSEPVRPAFTPPTRHTARRKPVVFASARPEKDAGKLTAAPPPRPLPSSLEGTDKHPTPPSPAQMLPTPTPANRPAAQALAVAMRPGRPIRQWPPAFDIRPAPPEDDEPARPARKAAVASNPAGQPQQRPALLPRAKSEPSEEAEPRAPAQERTSLQAQKLKLTIDRACGRFAHHVEIIEQPKGGLLVRIQAPNDALELLLLNRLMSLPEMSSDHIQLEAIIKP